MKLITFILTIVIVSANLLAQNNFYIPLNIKPAYEKNTRSMDGKPGVNYWQNRSEYNIKVNFDPAAKLLEGSEQITYYNNSPDSLSQIVIRLYHNISKPTAKRDFYLNEKAITDGVKLKKLLVADAEIDLSDRNKAMIIGTNLILNLPEKLSPKNSLKLSIDWETKIPDVPTIRFGSYDSTSVFVAYWYPQIAVYDDIDGWDRMDYSGTMEMYNDFSDFTVNYTVPAGYHIWSTGVWQNPDEILEQEFLDRYNKAWQSDEVVRIITKEDRNKKIYKNRIGYNTFIFTAKNVPDFAFGVSNTYLWDAVSFKPDKNSDRRVYCAAAYKETSKDFYDVAKIAKESLEFFSFKIPGVAYPYPSATVFNGAGGMEFPMIVNDGSSRTLEGTVGVTSHELAHQYMPFYMGTNERKYPFMDEGWAVMLPFDFQEGYVKGNNVRERNVSAYEEFAGNEYELPLMIPTPVINWRTSRTSSYTRPAIAYEILRNTLGDDLFLKGLHAYMERWNGKHPIPTDFFFTFNDVLKQDLSWYWKPWFYQFSYPDMMINKVKSRRNSITVEIKNIGGLPLPVKIQVMHNDVVAKEIYKTADIWKSGKDKVEIIIDGVKSFDALILGSDIIPDVNTVDNVYIK